MNVLTHIRTSKLYVYWQATTYYIDILHRFLRTKQQHIILIYCVNFLTSNNIYYIYILRCFLRTRQRHIILIYCVVS
jgi:hypothetical protein